MIDFIRIVTKVNNQSVVQVYPAPIVKRSKDLMIKGGDFYAFFDEESGLWSTDLYKLIEMVDLEILKTAEKEKEKGNIVRPQTYNNFDNGHFKRLTNYFKTLPDNYHPLGQTLVYNSDILTRESYANKRLSYDLVPKEQIRIEETGFYKLFSTLYEPQELDKILYIIGSIATGESKYHQHFFVFYGAPGTGKSTALTCLELLFGPYASTVDEEVTRNNSFSLESLDEDSLLMIAHDVDLSKPLSARFNSIVSKEPIIINRKYKKPYRVDRIPTLVMASNKPVMIHDSSSGINRRLIDIVPSGNKVPKPIYDKYLAMIKYELGRIMSYAINEYETRLRGKYDDYVPISMIQRTNIVHAFLSDRYHIYKNPGFYTLKQIYSDFVDYLTESNVPRKMTKNEFKFELMEYFHTFSDFKRVGKKQYRNTYEGLISNKIFPGLSSENEGSEPDKLDKDESTTPSISFVSIDEVPSPLSNELSEMPAKLDMYKPWSEVSTKLSDIDEKKVHFVILPKDMVVIDIDGETLEESLSLLEKAALPPTYTEISAGGSGLHLHYYYLGDVNSLSAQIAHKIEIKKQSESGLFAIRRKLTEHNNKHVQVISQLPEKKKKRKKMETIENEKHLRALIHKALRKEIHPHTTPNVHFIEHCLKEAKQSGISYDVTDLQPLVASLALSSTNNYKTLIRRVQNPKLFPFSSDDNVYDPLQEDNKRPHNHKDDWDEDSLVFFDIEVFPNLWFVCWKRRGSETINTLVNPSREEVETLLNEHLVGFNNKRYDNHILMAGAMGYTPRMVYDLSCSIIDNNSRGIRDAYPIGLDLYDYLSVRQSLKKYGLVMAEEYEEGSFDFSSFPNVCIKTIENLKIELSDFNLEFDEDLPDDKLDLAIKYCKNDVALTEALFLYKFSDFKALQIISELSKQPLNSSILKHVSAIIFGDDPKPQEKFIIPDLSKEFPFYEFKDGFSYVNGEVFTEGGYVFSEPGIYENVVYLDVASMHPASLINMRYFGEYTDRYAALRDARIAIKHHNLEKAKEILGFEGIDPERADDLSYALKIIVNKVYGYTTATFPNKFRSPLNKENVVAKRGALFMYHLASELQMDGIKVIHIKTDSIKIKVKKGEEENVIKMVNKIGKEYGYDFEVEGVFDYFVLFDDANAYGVVRTRQDERKLYTVGPRFDPYTVYELHKQYNIQPIKRPSITTLSPIKTVNKGRMVIGEIDPDGKANVYFHLGTVSKVTPVNKEMAPNSGNLLRETKSTDKEGFKYTYILKDVYFLPFGVAKNIPNVEEILDYDYLAENYRSLLEKQGELQHG